MLLVGELGELLIAGGMSSSDTKTSHASGTATFACSFGTVRGRTSDTADGGPRSAPSRAGQTRDPVQMSPGSGGYCEGSATHHSGAPHALRGLTSRSRC